MSIQLKKGTADILELSEKQADITDLQLPAGGNIPLMVSIDGKGVLHKLLDIAGNPTDAELIGQLLPNAQLNQFYLQKTALENGKVWVTIVRRDFIDLILEQVTARGWYINDLILGPFSLSTVLLIAPDFQASTVSDEDHVYRIQDQEIIDITSNKEIVEHGIYTVAGNELDTGGLVALGCAFQYYFKNEQIIRPDYAIVAEKSSEFFQRNIFRKAGATMLVFFLLCLLINFLTFDHYNRKYDDAAISLRENQALLSELNNLREELKQKKEFIRQGGFANASRISFVADELARTLPGNIRLQQMSVNPAQKRRRNEEKTVFQFDEILVVGTTGANIELNEWIKTTKAMHWVSEVNIVDISREKNKADARFELLIKIKQNNV